MYQEFFFLNHPPFLIEPAPDFIFFTEQHKEALAHLTYGLQGNGGFVVLTGEVGTGKTTICQFLLEDMPKDTDIASITNANVSEITLLIDICNQFSIEYDRKNTSLKTMFDALTSWMLENHYSGRHAIVLIDEAQHLSFNALEQLRLLTNIESDNQKPLQIILIGQTELQKKLLTTELRQLSQRITARYHLRPLNKTETNFYIHHRLNISGAKGPIFSAKTIPLIFKASHGIPRLINQICDRCLLTAYTNSSVTVTAKIAKKAINETELPKKSNPSKTYTLYIMTMVLSVFIALIISAQYPFITGYFEDSEKELMQQEWARIINVASEQKTSKPSTKITQKNIPIAEVVTIAKPDALRAIKIDSEQPTTKTTQKNDPITEVITVTESDPLPTIKIDSKQPTTKTTPINVPITEVVTNAKQPIIEVSLTPSGTLLMQPESLRLNKQTTKENTPVTKALPIAPQPAIEASLTPSGTQLLQPESLRLIKLTSEPSNTETTQANIPVAKVLASAKYPTTKALLSSAKTTQSIPIKSYSLQLVALPNKDSVYAFYKKHQQLQGKTFLYQKTNSKNKTYIILLGPFNTYKMAKKARDMLKKTYPTIDSKIIDNKKMHLN